MKSDWAVLSRIQTHGVQNERRTTARIALGRAVAHNYQWAVYLRKAVAHAIECGLTEADIHEILHGERTDNLETHHKTASEIADTGLSAEAIWELPIVVAGGRRMVQRLERETDEDFRDDISTLRRAHANATQSVRRERQ